MNPLQPFINGPITHRTLHDVNAGRPENSYEGLDAAIAALRHQRMPRVELSANNFNVASFKIRTIGGLTASRSKSLGPISGGIYNSYIRT